MKFNDLFSTKPIFGMVHLLGGSKEEMLRLAQKEVEIYLKNGICPLIENYFGSDEDCETVLKWMNRTHPDAIYGVNILGDYQYAFGLAAKYGAKFIQIDSVCGHLEQEQDEEYAEALNYVRRSCDVVLLGGVRFKYQPVMSGRSMAEDLRLAMSRCDCIVCTGEGTGLATPMEKVKEFKAVVKDFPVVVGAGVTIASLHDMKMYSDGAIVGSWFKQDHTAHNPVSEENVAEFMKVWN